MAAGNVAAHAGVTVKFDGTPTTMTAEACSQISGKSYRPTNAAKRCFDWRVDFVVLDDAVEVDDSDIEHIDYLNGVIKFASGYTVVGAVTVTGTYLPLTTNAYAKAFDFKVSPELLDRSVFGNAFKRYLRGISDFEFNLTDLDHGDDALGAATLNASFAAGTVRLISIEIIQDGATLANGGLVLRGLVQLANPGTNADPGSIVESSLKFEGAPTMSTNTEISGTWPVSWSVLDGASGLYI